jgi:quercetin dioxygenase-like cupin family protein
MTLSFRRVVTGHDDQGKATVKYDSLATNENFVKGGNVKAGRPGLSSSVVWTTDTSPADNNTDWDEGTRDVATAIAGGSVFRIIEYGPGVAPRRHRTDSIDYIIVLSGEIDMRLDGAEIVHLKAGEVLVQRGTIHDWVNNGSEPCVIAAVLVDAKPVEIDGKPLQTEG